MGGGVGDDDRRAGHGFTEADRHRRTAGHVGRGGSGSLRSRSSGRPAVVNVRVAGVIDRAAQ